MQEKKPLLSVIIPVYNVEKFVEECVLSVFNQNLEQKDFEIILVNDGSTDNSLEICRNIEKNNENVYVISQQNRGLSGARNTGIKHSRGEYLYFIDSDDFLEPGYLSDFLKIALANNYDFVGFGSKRVSHRYKDMLISSREELHFKLSGDGIQIIADFNFNNGVWWYLIKKNVLEDLWFVEDRLCEDGIFTAEMLLSVKNGVVYSNEVYNYYVNPDSIVQTVNSDRRKKMIRDMIFASTKFNAIIRKFDFNLNHKAFVRLRSRQQSYLFYAFIRMLKGNFSFKEFMLAIKQVNSGEFRIYPIKIFDGYGSMQNKLLIYVFNHKLFLRAVIFFNSKLKFIK